MKKTNFEKAIEALGLCISTDTRRPGLGYILGEHQGAGMWQFTAMDGYILLTLQIPTDEMSNLWREYLQNRTTVLINKKGEIRDYRSNGTDADYYPKWRRVFVTTGFKQDTSNMPIISVDICAKLQKIYKLLGVMGGYPFTAWHNHRQAIRPITRKAGELFDGCLLVMGLNQERLPEPNWNFDLIGVGGV